MAIVAGTKAEDVIKVINKMPISKRKKVKEITLDMAGSMVQIAKQCFPSASRVTDRFHVQQLAYDALDIRIKYRWEVIDAENEAIEKAKLEGEIFTPKVLVNGDTLKQLLARSRYLLFKNQSECKDRQKERAKLLFELYLEIEKAYKLTQELSWVLKTPKRK